ncbi:uncharacterized protein K02A2.6 [Trichonephila clavipes]|nr:uncharacterized protein K02A2.6 [Trichonephila clavipes]
MRQARHLPQRWYWSIVLQVRDVIRQFTQGTPNCNTNPKATVFGIPKEPVLESAELITSRLTGAGSLLPPVYGEALAKGHATGTPDSTFPRYGSPHTPNMRLLQHLTPQSLQTHAQNYLEELIAADIIEENTAEWASPIVLVKKNHINDNPSLRLALDLRLLNNGIDGCSYPLPKIQDITTKLAGFKLFTVLDLNSAYWQIHLPKEYRKILTFTTPWKTFQFNRLPFDIKHAAAYFQNMMDKVLSTCKYPGIHCYQDDIIIAANTIQELNAKLHDVLNALQENNLTLAPDKRILATQEIQYLGFTISSQGITPEISNTDKNL